MTAGVYLHIPFCKSRCSYCDFATDVYRDSAAVERYVEALCTEIQTTKVSRRPGKTAIDTTYFGGGTPSLLTAVQVEKILRAVYDRFDVAADAEVTMEMNPATVTAESLAAYRSLGVNRASFGVQTFNERDLKLLARGHDVDDARTTFRLLREAGFDNVSFDLIAGLPGQTMADWKLNLAEAVKLDPEHISLYLLEVHEGTPLAIQLKSGRRPVPDEDLAAEMYEVMQSRLAAAGFEQYEISNFSKRGFLSRHNTKYWRLDPVYGFGVSAHSFDGAERYANERDTAKFVEMIESRGTAEVMREAIDIASEYVFLGLRFEHGINLREFAERFGFDLRERYLAEIQNLSEDGLIAVGDARLRLTDRGKLFSNEVFQAFV